ncbi:MAG: hypothetical protein LC745_01525 [Planctomycetia bacterium]|nr:hypothetical protein [Planctomycetia bacterium]
MTIVVTVPCHGFPVQAIVATFGLDQRTVADWRDRAGRHSQRPGCCPGTTGSNHG